jgi:hypothetical protein
LGWNKVLGMAALAAVIAAVLISACNKRKIIPFEPLITATLTASATNTPVCSATITPTITMTFTVTPTFTNTRDISLTDTFTPTPTNGPGSHYGGFDMDYANSIANAPDGGYVLAGMTRSMGMGQSDIYLVKIDQNGQHIWDKLYGGPNNDVASAIIPSISGGYIVAGYTQSYGDPSGYPDGYIMKIDANGDCVWTRTVGSIDYDFLEAVSEAGDGSLYAAGSTRSPTNNYDFFLVKLDPSGNVIWQKSYGNGSLEMAHSITSDYSGGYVMAGERSGFFLVIDVNTSGNENWEKDNSTTYTYGIIHSIRKAANGGYILAGEEDVSGSNYNLNLKKMDSAGNISWQYNYGGSGYDNARDVIALSDGFLAVGQSNSFSSDAQVYFVRTDLNGGLLWQKTLGGTDFDAAYCMVPGSDSGFVIGGMTFSYGAGSPGDMLVMKIDASGGQLW